MSRQNPPAISHAFFTPSSGLAFLIITIIAAVTSSIMLNLIFCEYLGGGVNEYVATLSILCAFHGLPHLH